MSLIYVELAPNSIEFARDGCLRLGISWQQTIRVNKPEITSDSKIGGTVAHARACCAHLTREWPELWERSFRLDLNATCPSQNNVFSALFRQTCAYAAAIDFYYNIVYLSPRCSHFYYDISWTSSCSFRSERMMINCLVLLFT